MMWYRNVSNGQKTEEFLDDLYRKLGQRKLFLVYLIDGIEFFFGRIDINLELC